MTSSGYPRIVKEWKRGTPVEQARVVYEGKPGDMYIAALRDHTPGFERDFVSRTLAFYNDELYLRDASGAAEEDRRAQLRQQVRASSDWLLLELREPYEAGGKSWPAGSLIATKFDDFMAGKREFTALFTPSERTSLSGYTVDEDDHLVLNVLDDVKNRLSVLTPGAGGVDAQRVQAARRRSARWWCRPVDPDESDAVWLTATDYLTPTTLSLAQLGDEAPEVLKTMPAFFDASNNAIEQHFATSKDGTRVPYFLVRPKDLKLDGTAPTLLYGYGGFEISLTPAYSGSVGKGWLEKGGVYAVANIRGGGEYGPRWHQAALKANRHKAYEDFAAVAQGLIARKVTSTPHLGIQGGSNGGLLTGNMLDAVSGPVRRRRGAGAAARHEALQPPAGRRARGWPSTAIPDTADWDFIRGFSPYHLFDAKRELPAGALHDLHPRRPRPPGPCAQDGGEDARSRQGRPLLREHRGRPRRFGQQRAGRAHERAGLHVPVE